MYRKCTFALQREMGWKSLGNSVKRITEYRDIHKNFSTDSGDQQEMGLMITVILLDIGLMVCSQFLLLFYIFWSNSHKQMQN